LRTRFAPSPTGFLHLGSVRTALFSWLLAKHHHGQFILRIEDTDQERSKPEYTQLILDAMSWLGLTWDEGPFYQSKRYDRYNEVIEQLIATGHAYYCDCSKERLTSMREQQIAEGQNTHYDGHCRERGLASSPLAVVRLKLPPYGSLSFEDLLHGEQERDQSVADDWILRRSDGCPTYNFAVVVDDYDMDITHVVRGDDHLSNTPKQVSVYQALGWPMPKFCHIPMILDEHGSRLSKRSGSANVLAYREQGYLPAALLNAIVRLGWSHGDQELFTIDEMISLFDFDGLHRSAACFNEEKFFWIARQTLQKSSVETLVNHAITEGFFTFQQRDEAVAVINLFKDREKNVQEMILQSQFLKQAPVLVMDEFKKNYPVITTDLLKSLTEMLDSTVLSKETFFADLKSFAIQHGLKIKDLALPLRMILTGTIESPDLGSVVFYLGKEETIRRISTFY
jgi:glutamyl-tRNA synthetase